MACLATGVSLHEAIATSVTVTALYVGVLYLPFNVGDRDNRRVIASRIATLTVLSVMLEVYTRHRVPDVAHKLSQGTRLPGVLVGSFLTLLLYAGHLVVTPWGQLAPHLRRRRGRRRRRRQRRLRRRGGGGGGGDDDDDDNNNNNNSNNNNNNNARGGGGDGESDRDDGGDDEEEDEGGRESRLVALRNYVAAPMLEEVVFRRQTLLLWSCQPPMWRLLFPSLLFALAHVHHAVALGVATVLLHMAYTFLFAVYATALYVNTLTVWAAYAAHVVCNLLELPDFAAIAAHRRARLIACLYAACLALFAVAFTPLTTMVRPYQLASK